MGAGAGLLVNPAAARSNGKGLALVQRLDGRAPVRIMNSFGELRAHLAALAAAGVRDLYISSGDGTVQAILTELGERNPFAVLPRIGLLPHGTTNLSGPDLGLRVTGIAAQARLLMDDGVRQVTRRPTLRAVNCGDGQMRHGLFVGTGAVADATLFCQQAFNARGVRGTRAVIATLASAAGKALFRKPAPDDPTRLDRPYPIAVNAGGRRLTEGDLLLAMATTLDRLVLGTRPFWNKGAGAIRCTTLPYPVPPLWRYALPVMYGSENRRSPPGCLSFSADALEISSRSRFVIDGEFFDPPQDAPLRVETGPMLDFIRG